MSFIARISEKSERSGVVFPSKSADEVKITLGERVFLELSGQTYDLGPVSNAETGLWVVIPDTMMDELKLQPGMKLYVRRKDEVISMRVLTTSFNDWMTCKTCSGTFHEGR